MAARLFEVALAFAFRSSSSIFLLIGGSHQCKVVSFEQPGRSQVERFRGAGVEEKVIKKNFESRLMVGRVERKHIAF